MLDLALHLPVSAAEWAQSRCVAFQSPTANAWAYSFLRRLEARLTQECPQHAHALALQIARTAQRTFDQHPHPKANREACIAAGVCALLVASHRLLGRYMGRALGGNAQALALTQHCLEASYQSFVARVCVPLYREGSPGGPDLAALNFAHWSAHLYPDITATDGSGYADFFRNHGADELTGLLRAVDAAWQRAASALVTGPQYAFTDRQGEFSPFRFAVQTPQAQRKVAPCVMRLVVGAH